MPSLDLDVDGPEEVARVLRAAAEQFYASEGELQAAWQDKAAGRVWRALAAALERCALSCDKACEKYL